MKNSLTATILKLTARKKRLGCLLILVLAGGLLLFWRSGSCNSRSQSTNNNDGHYLTVPEHCFLRDQFYDITNSHQPDRALDGVRAVVVPHHLTASHLIADGINLFAVQEIETVIVIAPNHFETGRAEVQTSFYGWETEEGVVASDQKTVSHLLQQLAANNTLLAVNDHTIANEHGIAGLMPFIAHYLPQAQLIQLALSRSVDIEQLQLLTQAFVSAKEQGLLDWDKTAIVGSVDFSHYLLPQEAQEKDIVTQELMIERHWQQLMALDNDYLDSPGSVWLTFRLAALAGAEDLHVLANTNSGEINHRWDQGCTSYFELALTR